MKENQITFISADGKEELANILFTHEKWGNTYVVFEFVESLQISAAMYVETSDGQGEIVDIQSDKEWEILDELLEQYFDELEEAMSEEDLFTKE